MQVYIVSGGYGSGNLASTETLVKDGGSAWQLVASLPSARRSVTSIRGLGLDNGQFIASGECWMWTTFHNYNLDALQEATVTGIMMKCFCTTQKRTGGPQLVISLQPGASIA